MIVNVHLLCVSLSSDLSTTNSTLSGFNWPRAVDDHNKKNNNIDQPARAASSECARAYE